MQSRCERCNADFQFVDDNTTAGCACPVGSTQVQSPSGSVCFPGDQSIPNPQGTVYQIVYAANAQQESQYLVNNFPAEYFKCTVSVGKTTIGVEFSEYCREPGGILAAVAL